MTISHSIPSTTRKPGIYHEFDAVSGATGLTPVELRLLVVGIMGSGGTATANTPVQIFDEADADLKLDQGSEAALGCRRALGQFKRLGIAAELWCCPLADPSGTATVETLTASGTATEDGDVVFRIAGRTLFAGVSSGDDDEAVAAAIKAAIDEAAAILPVTAALDSEDAAEVEVTANYTGVNGNDIAFSVVSTPAGVTVTPAQATEGATAVVLTTALANALVKDFRVVAIGNHTSTDVTALDTHLDAAWAAAAKRWRFGIIGETGTLSAANTLSAAANDYRQIVASYEGCPNLPIEVAAAVGAALVARGSVQPNYNWDAEELDLYVPPDASAYTDAEIESALSSGSTPLAPSDDGARTEIVRLITTKTTEGGNPFENTKDVATINGWIATARQLDALYAQRYKGVNKNAQVLKRMRSDGLARLRLLEERGVTQNVEEHKDEFIVETDGSVATRAVVQVPESIVPNLHQTVLKHVLIVE